MRSSVFLHGIRMDFTACRTAALTFVRDHRERHHVDAVTITAEVGDFPRLPCERLYLEPW